MANERNSRLVWSDDLGGSVSQKRTTKSSKKSGTPSKDGPQDGVVRVSRETKGRKGKGVTLVTGLPLEGAELKALAKELKQKCGTGGTLKDNRIEIQGDHRDLLVQLLQEKGYPVKKVGG